MIRFQLTIILIEVKISFINCFLSVCKIMFVFTDHVVLLSWLTLVEQAYYKLELPIICLVFLNAVEPYSISNEWSRLKQKLAKIQIFLELCQITFSLITGSIHHRLAFDTDSFVSFFVCLAFVMSQLMWLIINYFYWQTELLS